MAEVSAISLFLYFRSFILGASFSTFVIIIIDRYESSSMATLNRDNLPRPQLVSKLFASVVGIKGCDTFQRVFFNELMNQRN